VSRKADGERFDVFFFITHASIIQQKWMHVKKLECPCTQAPNKDHPFYPPACTQGDRRGSLIK
jgi:hypothetical protein